MSAPHFIVGPHSGDSLEAVGRMLADDALRSGHPDHYNAVFARAIQIIAMHKIPPQDFYGFIPDNPQTQGSDNETQTANAADGCCDVDCHGDCAGR